MKNQNANRTLPLRGMLWAGIFSLLVLGSIYLKAESRLRELTANLARLTAESAPAEQQVTTLQHEVDQVADDIAAVVGRQTASADEIRRNATLAVIARLKAAHQANPPEPPKKAPPVPFGPRGMIFPELMNDPEYSAAYLVTIRSTLRRTKMPELLRLGLSEELAEKVIAVLAERDLSFEDYRQLAGEGAGMPGKIAAPINEEMNSQLKKIMGDEFYKRYAALNESTIVMVPIANGNGSYGRSVPSHEALVAQSRDQYLSPLAQRLSYSDSPLQPVQVNQLAELLATSSAASGEPIYKRMYSDSFIEQASTVLTPTQLEAIRQLRAERLAWDIRAKLPKSSELPRNAPVAK